MRLAELNATCTTTALPPKGPQLVPFVTVTHPESQGWSESQGWTDQRHCTYRFLYLVSTFSTLLTSYKTVYCNRILNAPLRYKADKHMSFLSLEPGQVAILTHHITLPDFFRSALRPWEHTWPQLVLQKEPLLSRWTDGIRIPPCAAHREMTSMPSTQEGSCHGCVGRGAPSEMHSIFREIMILQGPVELERLKTGWAWECFQLQVTKPQLNWLKFAYYFYYFQLIITIAFVLSSTTWCFDLYLRYWKIQ